MVEESPSVRKRIFVNLAGCTVRSKAATPSAPWQIDGYLNIRSEQYVHSTQPQAFAQLVEAIIRHICPKVVISRLSGVDLLERREDSLDCFPLVGDGVDGCLAKLEDDAVFWFYVTEAFDVDFAVF